MVVSSNRAVPAQPHVRAGGCVGLFRSGGLLTAFDPGFDFFQIPDHAARCQPKAQGKLAALLHFVDGCFRQGHDLTQLASANRAAKGER